VTLSQPSFSSRAAAAAARSHLIGRMVDRIIPAPSAGRLALTLPNGDVIARQGTMPGPDATIVIKHWRLLARLLLDAEDGFARGYIDGDWSTPDLAELLALAMSNETTVTPHGVRASLSNATHRVGHKLRSNTRHGSRRNIAAHYDLGNAFFAPWLDTGMNYSSALYRGVYSDETLEQAQDYKLDRIAQLLDVKGGENVLEIGCGWGALADRLVRGHDAKVCGITLSAKQLAYARTRLGPEITTGRAELRLADYRDLTGTFDRIASIEMIEAVGEDFWPVYFETLRARLAPGGVAVLQAITIDEPRFAAYRARPDFIQRYIFPGGMLPTRSIISDEAARAGLTLAHHESFGSSYARTLREWRRRFRRAAEVIDTQGFDARFRRMWDYYLVYCETGFRCAAIDVGFFKFTG
jgi:cyclopropane-fatty-acyl-phospholipid synthase